MKRRRQKHAERRHIAAAFRTSKRELGDHRRWWWVATMPRRYFDPVFGCETEVYFDPKWGRCYVPDCWNGRKDGAETSPPPA